MATDLGKDTSCTTELRTGRYATGARLVAESAYRRLTTPRGTLRGGEEEANFGEDLTKLIGSATTKGDAASLPGRIQSELKKDERIETVDVTVTEINEGPAKTFLVRIEAETLDGPFSLKLGVSEVAVGLLGITG